MRGNETITIHRRAEQGLHGDRGLAAPDRVVANCIVYPTEGVEEETARQDVVISRLTIVKQVALDVRYDDEITVRGLRHDVDGPPQVYRKGSKITTIINVRAVE